MMTGPIVGAGAFATSRPERRELAALFDVHRDSLSWMLHAGLAVAVIHWGGHGRQQPFFAPIGRTLSVQRTGDCPSFVGSSSKTARSPAPTSTTNDTGTRAVRSARRPGRWRMAAAVIDGGGDPPQTACAGSRGARTGCDEWKRHPSCNATCMLTVNLFVYIVLW